jgi:hypothetical protein
MADGAPIVKPEFRPTLPELLRARFGAHPRRAAAWLVGALLVVVAVGLALYVRHQPASYAYDRGPVPFSFSYGGALHRVAARPGELVRLEQRSDGRLVQAVVARPLRLPAYRGALSGSLPLFASGVDRALAVRYPSFVPVGEGRLNPGSIPLYGIGFVSRSGGRPLYGLDILAVPGKPGGRRDGIELTLLATREAGVHSADQIGLGGALRTVLISFGLG